MIAKAALTNKNVRMNQTPFRAVAFSRTGRGLIGIRALGASSIKLCATACALENLYSGVRSRQHRMVLFHSPDRSEASLCGGQGSSNKRFHAPVFANGLVPVTISYNTSPNA